MNFNHEELMLMMLYNTGTRMGLIHELRLMQCYLMPDETALRELSEGVIEKIRTNSGASGIGQGGIQESAEDYSTLKQAPETGYSTDVYE